MTAPADTHPALALTLKRGGRHAAGLEIIDAASGKPAAIIPDGELASVVERLLLAAPDLLWANLRASAHINGEPSSITPEALKLCRLLNEALDRATRLPATK